jgi:hypothetical protein
MSIVGIDSLESYLQTVAHDFGDMFTIVAGDLNARPGLEQDFISDDFSTYLPEPVTGWLGH